MSNDLLPKINEVNVDMQLNDITQRLLDSQDYNSSKDLMNEFNWSINKKYALRLMKLSGLFDSMTDEMLKRFLSNPNNFSNTEIATFMNVVQGAIDKSTKAIKGADEPVTIQVKQDNSNNINVNILDNFDRDSKERIADAIKGILTAAGNGTIDIPTDDFEEN